MKVATLLCLLTVSLSGCAALRVEVDVLKDDCLRPGWRRTVVEQAIPEIQRDLRANKYEELADQIIQSLTENIKALKTCGQLPENAAEEAPDNVSKNVRERIKLAESDFRAVISLVRQAGEIVSSSEDVQRAQLYDAAYSHLSAGRFRLAELENDMRHSIRDGLVHCIRGSEDRQDISTPDVIVLEAKAAAQNIEKAVVTLSSVIEPYSLASDRLASAAIYSDQTCWEGLFNEAYGRGTGGNGDIAIVMETPTAFSVKALRNDTTKITEATFLVLNSGLKVLAASQGLSIPDAATADFSAEVGAITAARSEQVKVERAQKLTGRVIVGLMDAILAESDASRMRRDDPRHSSESRQHGVTTRSFCQEPRVLRSPMVMPDRNQVVERLRAKDKRMRMRLKNLRVLL